MQCTGSWLLCVGKLGQVRAIGVYSVVVVHRLLIVMASVVAERKFQDRACRL